MIAVKEAIQNAPRAYRRHPAELRKRLWPESGAINSIPALDGLRALAVLLVMLYHSWTFVPGYVNAGQSAGASPLFYGKTGVQLFFVLSGFLLSLPYAQWIFGLRSRPSTLLFYKRRALRVGPAYWVSLALLGLTLPFTFASLRDVLFHAAFLSNVSWQTTFTINGVYWTMAIEVQFYVLLPLIAAAMRGLSVRTRPAIATAVIVGTLIAVSVLSAELGMIHSLSNIPVVGSALLNYSAMPYWLAVFGFGIACSVFYVFVTRIAVLDVRMKNQLRRLASLAGAGGIVVALALAVIPALHTIPLLDLAFGVAYVSVLFGVLLGGKALNYVFASRPMRFLGLISYSFYIWHRVVLHVIAPHLRFGSYGANFAAIFALGLILSVAVAYLSYQVVERPFIRARTKTHDVVAPTERGATTSTAPM